MTTTPLANAYPRGLHGVYRGRIVRQPKTIERSGRAPMVTSRIAVNMSSGSTPKADRDALTEWVNVIAFSERNGHLLSQCAKGRLIAVSGNVTKEFYQTRTGERAVSRTIIVEDIVSAAGSLQPNVSHPADMDDTIETRLADNRRSRSPRHSQSPMTECRSLTNQRISART